MGFVRQRRNLIGFSLALLFYETSGLLVRKLSFFGNEVDVANPTLAGTALWIGLEPPIYILPVTHPYNYHEQDVVMNLIDDAVDADANS